MTIPELARTPDRRFTIRTTSATGPYAPQYHGQWTAKEAAQWLAGWESEAAPGSRATARVMTLEEAAHDQILAMCRSGAPWVMRQAPTDPLPGYEWPTRYRVRDMAAWGGGDIIAQGDTWEAMLPAVLAAVMAR